MASGMRLDVNEREHLEALGRSVGRPEPATARLVELGLADSGSGRYGPWVRITEFGRELLARHKESIPVGVPGPGAPAPGTLLSGSAPGQHTTAETQAQPLQRPLRRTSRRR